MWEESEVTDGKIKCFKEMKPDEEFWVELPHHLCETSTKRHKQHSILEKTMLWTFLLPVSRTESATQGRAGKWAILNAANEGTKFNLLEKITYQTKSSPGKVRNEAATAKRL